MKFENKYIYNFYFAHYKHPINRLPTTNCNCPILHELMRVFFFFFRKTVWKVSSYRRVSHRHDTCAPTQGHLPQQSPACFCDTNVLPSGVYFDTYLTSSLTLTALRIQILMTNVKPQFCDNINKRFYVGILTPLSPNPNNFN